MKKGLVFIVSAPAGTGKTTLVKMLLNEFPHVVRSISYTTRPMRRNEVANRDYFFISPEEFENKIAHGDFLEYAQVFGHFYGTSRSFVESQTVKGKHVILIIDTQGALSIMEQLNAISIFISPPNLIELKSRLHRRKSESQEAIEHRLSFAEKEISLAPRYTYHIVNDHLKTAYSALRAILIAEEHRNR